MVKRLGGRNRHSVVQKLGKTDWLVRCLGCVDWQEAIEGSERRVGLRVSGFQDSSSGEVPLLVEAMSRLSFLWKTVKL